jgi:hypothetical protein
VEVSVILLQAGAHHQVGAGVLQAGQPYQAEDVAQTRYISESIKFNGKPAVSRYAVVNSGLVVKTAYDACLIPDEIQISVSWSSKPVVQSYTVNDQTVGLPQMNQVGYTNCVVVKPDRAVKRVFELGDGSSVEVDLALIKPASI